MTQNEIETLGIEDLIVRDPMHDPKYSCTEGRVYHREKQYLIPVDEKVYILRGNDPIAPQMANWYYETLKQEDQTEIVVGHQETSIERVETFINYHKAHPERIGKLYSARDETPPLLMGTEEDAMMDPEYFMWNFRFFHRDFHFWIEDDEPLMIFRSKDALLVRIIDKHNEFIDNNPELYDEQDAEALKFYNGLRRKQVLSFHLEHPERVGVTCAVFQKPKSEEYKAVLDKFEDEREKAWKDLGKKDDVTS